MSYRFPYPPQGFRTKLGVEDSTGESAAAFENDTVVGTANTYYSGKTMPSTHPLYLLTAVEVANGTVVNGSFMVGIHRIDAIPPTRNASVLIGHTLIQAQTGADAVQKTSEITPNCIVPGGTVLALGVVSNSATSRLKTKTVANQNNLRAITLTQATLTGASTAWAAGTEEIYAKLYFKPLL